MSVIRAVVDRLDTASSAADHVALSCSALLMPFSTGAASLLIQSEL